MSNEMFICFYIYTSYHRLRTHFKKRHLTKMERRSFYSSPNVRNENRLQKLSRFPSQTNLKYRCRIIVFGSAGVGKSAIIQQFLFAKFIKKYTRTVEDMFIAEYNSRYDNSLKLEILDTAGSYEFPAMRSLAISNGDAFILVYSVDNEASWEHLKRLRNEV